MNTDLYYIAAVHRKTLHEWGAVSVEYRYIVIDDDNKFTWTYGDDASYFTLQEIVSLSESFDDQNNWVDYESYEYGLLHERDLVPVEPFDSRFMT